MLPEPKYHPNQVLRITHTWAKYIQPRPVENFYWNVACNHYSYSFPWLLIWIEERMLEPIGEPDMTPEEWKQKRIEILAAEKENTK